MTATADELSTTVLAVFRDVLGQPAITDEDDFFEAGGDSLLAVDATERLSGLLGREVEAGALIMFPSAAALAEAIAGGVG